MTDRVERSWLERWYNLTGVMPDPELLKTRNWNHKPAMQKMSKDARSDVSKKFRSPTDA